MSEATSERAQARGLVPVIGLEVHAQLATRSKLFCACRNVFGAPPNANTCPVCSGQPGVLPVLNDAAVRLAVRAGLALGCEVAAVSRFDRKNYFYADLPKGYQITQYDRPLLLGGRVPLDGTRGCPLRRIHMEEDAGKAIHDQGERTRVDLNRAGVPLVEIVGEPELHAAADAQAFVASLREILRYARVCDGEMEKGSLRCDVNVSLHAPDTPLGTRVELKNLNSIRHVGDAIEHEIERQGTLLAAGEAVEQETRLWDPAAGVTRTMRTKEDEQDYRYFPEPDLPPLVLDPAQIEDERARLPELPAVRRARYRDELGLSEYDAGVLTADREVAELFEEVARRSGNPRAAANWIANDVLGALADDAVPGTSLAELRVGAEELAALIALTDEGTLHSSGARTVLAEMLRSGRPPAELVAELGLEQVTDPDTIEAWCREALEGAERVIENVLAGRTKALGALVGPIMKRSGGRANPRQVQETLRRIIEQEHGA